MYYAKHCRFVSAFKEDPQVPVGDTNLDSRGLLTAATWICLVSALRSSGDRVILHRCKTPKEAWTNLTKWFESQTQEARTEYYRKMHSSKVAADQNLLTALGELNDMTAELCASGLVVDNSDALRLLP